MQKTPVINGTLFVSSLKRYWPLWLTVLIVWALAYLAPFSSMSDFIRGVENFQLTQLWKSMFVMAVPIACVLSIVPVMLLSERLFSAKAATFYGSAPQSRRTLFFTAYAASLAPLAVIELLVALLLAALISPASGFNAGMVCEWYGFVLACTFVFTALAQLVCELTGSRAVAVFLYLLLNVLVVCLTTAVWLIVRVLLFGLEGSYLEAFWASPLIALMQYASFGTGEEQIVNWPAVAAYCVAALAFLAAAFALDGRREAESAGEVVAFSWLRPILKYLAGICAALFLGVVVNAVQTQSLVTHNPLGLAGVVVLAIAMVVGAFLGVLFAQMVLERSARVLHSSWKGGLVIACAACLFVGVTYADPLALQNRVPDVDDVASVELQEYTMCVADVYTDKGIEAVCELQQDILAERENLVASYGETDTASSEIGIVYHMNDGSTIKRCYPLCYEVNFDTGYPDEDTVAYKLISQAYAIADDPQVKKATVSHEFEDAQDGNVTIMFYQNESADDADDGDGGAGDEGAAAGDASDSAAGDETIAYEGDSDSSDDDAMSQWIESDLSAAQVSDFVENALLPDIENIHSTAWFGLPEMTTSTELEIDVTLAKVYEDSYTTIAYRVDTKLTPHTVAWLAKNFPDTKVTYTQSGKTVKLGDLA